MTELKEPMNTISAMLKDPNKTVVIYMAPAVRVGIGEFLGDVSYSNIALKTVSAMRKLGFKHVFDMSFSADMTTFEETTELLIRLKENKDLPQFTSCCPGWVRTFGTKVPQLEPHLSTTKSPQAIFGSVLKTYYAEKNGLDPKNQLVTVSLVPCVIKKAEAQKQELWQSGEYPDVDHVITTKDFFEWCEAENIKINEEPEGMFDDLFGGETGSGVIYGSTGGVMGAALRTLLKIVTGKADLDLTPLRGTENIKTLEIKIDEVAPVPPLLQKNFENFDFLKGRTLKIAVCHSVPSIMKIALGIHDKTEFHDYDFIEFMMCQGGCVGGAGQMRSSDSDALKKRAEALTASGKKSEVKTAIDNPALLKLYAEYFPDGPCTEKALKVLHKH